MARQALLQEQLGRADHRVGVEAIAHLAADQRVAQRDERHALVVREVRLDDRARLARRYASGRVVERLVVAVAALGTLGGERGQVGEHVAWRDGQREQRGVRCDDDVVGKPALQAEPGHAERLVLVGEGGVLGVERRLAHAPRHAARPAVVDLRVARPCAYVSDEQRGRPVAHHQQRHQVLEHRRAPAHERASLADLGEVAAEAEPVLLRHVALGDREEARQATFARQQVVVAVVEPALVEVVADREQVAVLVVEHREVRVLPHLACDVGRESQSRQQLDARPGATPRSPSSDLASPIPRPPGACADVRRRQRVELVERLRPAPRRARQARARSSKQRLQRRRCRGLPAGASASERRPRSEPAEQLERLGDGASHVADGRRELLERRDRNAEPRAGLVADRRCDARRRMRLFSARREDAAPQSRARRAA